MVAKKGILIATAVAAAIAVSACTQKTPEPGSAKMTPAKAGQSCGAHKCRAKRTNKCKSHKCKTNKCKSY